MPEPLIDRDVLDEVLDGHLMYLGKERVAAADAVITYLRSVLTPEALDTHGTRTRDPSGRWIYRVRTPTGDGLYRRIFGEDR